MRLRNSAKKVLIRLFESWSWLVKAFSEREVRHEPHGPPEGGVPISVGKRVPILALGDKIHRKIFEERPSG
jgi:hypothetical protein